MRKLGAIIVAFVLLLFCLPVAAQEDREMHWENVTVLNFAATGGTDREATLQQYLLFDEAVLDKHRDLLEQYKTFAEEFMQMSLNAEAPQMNKETDEKNEYTWGAIDYDEDLDVENGKCVLCKNGMFGIVTLDNKQLLPFEYKKIKGWKKNEWLVAKDGKNWGFMDGSMKIVIPMKYDSLWDGHDNVIEMLRFDKMLDVYDATSFQLLRTIPKPHD